MNCNSREKSSATLWTLFHFWHFDDGWIVDALACLCCNLSTCWNLCVPFTVCFCALIVDDRVLFCVFWSTKKRDTNGAYVLVALCRGCCILRRRRWLVWWAPVSCTWLSITVSFWSSMCFAAGAANFAAALFSSLPANSCWHCGSLLYANGQSALLTN